MQQIKTIEELNEVKANGNCLIKFGQPNCIPCAATGDNLKEIEESGEIKLTFYECDDINVITSLGYTSVPAIEIVTEAVIASLKDRSIMMDKDELLTWIKDIVEVN